MEERKGNCSAGACLRYLALRRRCWVISARCYLVETEKTIEESILDGNEGEGIGGEKGGLLSGLRLRYLALRRRLLGDLSTA